VYVCVVFVYMTVYRMLLARHRWTMLTPISICLHLKQHSSRSLSKLAVVAVALLPQPLLQMLLTTKAIALLLLAILSWAQCQVVLLQLPVTMVVMVLAVVVLAIVCTQMQ
jgi:hypothetical protein